MIEMKSQLKLRLDLLLTAREMIMIDGKGGESLIFIFFILFFQFPSSLNQSRYRRRVLIISKQIVQNYIRIVLLKSLSAV